MKRRDLIKTIRSYTVPILPRIFSAVVSVLTVPILINNVGLEVFGIFSLFVSFRIVQSFADLGVSNALVSELIDNKFNVGKSEFFRLILKLIVFNFLFACVALLVTKNVELSLVFDIPQLFQEDFNLGLAIYFFGSIPFFSVYIVQKFYIAKGNYIFSSFLVNSIYILSNIGVVSVSFLSRPLPYMVLMLVVLPAIISFVFMFKFIAKFPSGVQTSVLNSQKFRRSAQSFLKLQIATSFSTQIDPLVLGFFLGPVQVGLFSSTFKILTIILILISLSLTPVWPNVKNLSLSNDKFATIEYFKKTFFLYFSISIVLSLLFFEFFDFLIPFLYGGIVVVPSTLKFAFVFWIPIFTTWQLVGNFMNGLDQQNWLVKFYFMNSIANFFLSFVFLFVTQNLASTIISACVSTILFLIIPMFFKLRKMFRSLS